MIDKIITLEIEYGKLTTFSNEPTVAVDSTEGKRIVKRVVEEAIFKFISNLEPLDKKNIHEQAFEFLASKETSETM